MVEGEPGGVPGRRPPALVQRRQEPRRDGHQVIGRVGGVVLLTRREGVERVT